jgi:hypothetical protein
MTRLNGRRISHSEFAQLASRYGVELVRPRNRRRLRKRNLEAAALAILAAAPDVDLSKGSIEDAKAWLAELGQAYDQICQAPRR